MRRLLLSSIPILYSQTVFLEPPSYQEKIRGVYENKIRQNAAPEKVFETFASVKEGKRFFMTPTDLFKAITPFNYSPASSYNFLEKQESLIIRAFDANKDGRISFAEYFFFIVLLSTPNKYFRDFIKKSGNRIDRKGFTEMMLEAKKSSPQGKRLVNTKSIDPRSTNITDSNFQESCDIIFEEIFKNKEKVTWDDFRSLKDLISEELLTYEFYQFQVEDESITAEDFGKSIIAYMSTFLSEMYLSRLEKIKPTGRVTLKEYLAFMFVMQEAHVIHQKLLLEHMEHGNIETNNIRKVLNQVCSNSPYCSKKNLQISDLQIEVFINLLDLDSSGTLEPEELLHLVSNRGSQGTGQASAPNFEEVVTEFKKFLNVLLKFVGITPVFKPKAEKHN